jgi:hypothetical protein
MMPAYLPLPLPSQMNTKPATGTTPQGFALFSSHAHAQAAMLMLHDHQFDTDCHLRCEIAHKNMYLKVCWDRLATCDGGLGVGFWVTCVVLGSMYRSHVACIAPWFVTAWLPVNLKRLCGLPF